jgi:hypothetical protein
MMAHWAELNENNEVIRVTVGDNNDTNGDEGYQWLIDTIGGRWVKTSCNTISGEHILGGTPLRKNFAGIGYTYDPVRDAFIPPKKNLSFVFNEDKCIWEPPIPAPADAGITKFYKWDEEIINWVEIPTN